MTIKVMSFNIHHGRGSDGRLNLDRIADIIQQTGADVVGLSEVDRHYGRRSEFQDQAAVLADRLRMRFSFGAAISNEEGEQYGNAILSRFPIAAERSHGLNKRTLTAESRALLECELAASERPIKAYMTHLSIGPFLRRKQIARILGIIGPNPAKTILMGDFNFRPRSKGWMAVTEHFADASEAGGVSPSRTFPAFRPKLQLDYIFVSTDIRVRNVCTITNIRAASDHLPLVAAIETEGVER